MNTEIKSAEEILRNHYENMKKVNPEKNWNEWEVMVQDGTVKLISDVAEEYASQFKQQSNVWIKPSERLPELGQLITSVRDTGDNLIYESGFWCKEDLKYWKMNNITHWMLLPNPPNNDELPVSNVSEENPLLSAVSYEKVAVMFLEWAHEKYWRTAKRLGGAWFKVGDGGNYNASEVFKIFLKEMEEELSSVELTAYYSQLEAKELQIVDVILLAKAKSLDLSVDFSDKWYDGDKECPMDRIGLLDYLLNEKEVPVSEDPATPESTANWQKVGDNDAWLDEVRGNESEDVDDFKQVTGFNYEKGREDEEKVIMEAIKNWEGKTNSHFGQAMKDTFEKWQKQQPDKIQEAIEWCDENIKEHFHPNESIENKKYAAPYKMFKKYLLTLK